MSALEQPGVQAGSCVLKVGMELRIAGKQFIDLLVSNIVFLNIQDKFQGIH